MTTIPGLSRRRPTGRDRAPLAPSSLLPVLALSVATALWGSTFFMSKAVVAEHDPLTLLTLRFALASLVMWLARPRALLGLSRRTWLRAAGLGAVYGVAQIPHYFGLQRIAAAEAGFLIGTYVVLTPVLGLVLFRLRPSWVTSAGVVLAGCGIAVLFGGTPGLGLGQLLTLIAAALYALQIVLLGRWSLPGEAWALTTIQMMTITVVVAVPAGIRGMEASYSRSDWLVVLYLALVASVLAIGVQTWAQSRIAASHAAVIMAAEPLWAAGLAVAFTAEILTANLLAAGALLIAANLLIALVDRNNLHLTLSRKQVRGHSNTDQPLSG